MAWGMQQRQLGRSGLEVSALGLGCIAMSDFYGPRYEREALATIHRAIECGVNFFDTADIYGLGRNEELWSAVPFSTGATAWCLPRNAAAYGHPTEGSLASMGAPIISARPAR